VTGDLRKMHNFELHDLYNSLNIAKLITGACMQAERYVKFILNFDSNRKKRDNLENPGVDVRIIFKLTAMK
jgi:hypothetical protein